MRTCVIVLLLIGGVTAMRAHNKAKGTPVDQVISLLEDLQTQTQEEGDEEATTYEEFACFCKDTTKEKSDAIQADQTEIDSQSATMIEKDTLRQALEKEIQDLNNEIAQCGIDMTDAQKQRDADNAKYEATSADLENAVSNVNTAIDTMSDVKDEVSLSQVKASIRKTLLMADVLDVSPKTQRALNAFIQESDDGVPENDSEFHGNQLLDVMSDLAKRYAEKKTAVDEEEAQAVSSHNAYMAAKTSQKETAESNLEKKTGDLEDCNTDLGTATEALTTAKAMLSDDEQYMKDLTANCELKANEWDQRSKMRADELAAISQALAVIQDRVKGKADAATARALVQTTDADSAPTPVKDQEDVDDDDVDDDDLSFLQKFMHPKRKVGALLKKAQQRHRKKAMLQEPEQKQKQAPADVQQRVMQILSEKSQKLKSPILASLAMKLSADPFVKVKKLIQELVERLVTEAADEATQKGWCDTELGKAKTDRNNEHTSLLKTNAKVQKLEAQRDLLSDEIAQLTSDLADLNDSLSQTTNMRNQEKSENLNTITQNQEGLDAVTDAIGILKNFYKGAGKAKVLLQGSPVSEDAPGGAAAQGAYKGNQGAAANIIGLMEVIKSDFERAIKKTKEAEFEAAREFATFDTETKASIKSKETSKEMKEADETKANSGITQGMSDLNSHQQMLDDALKQLESLKPACIDTGMSYSERVAKREEEIDALKNAMCILDTDGVESDC